MYEERPAVVSIDLSAHQTGLLQAVEEAGEGGLLVPEHSHQLADRGWGVLP
jgi:hypothetical protein